MSPEETFKFSILAYPRSGHIFDQITDLLTNISAMQLWHYSQEPHPTLCMPPLPCSVRCGYIIIKIM